VLVSAKIGTQLFGQKRVLNSRLVSIDQLHPLMHIDFLVKVLAQKL